MTVEELLKEIVLFENLSLHDLKHVAQITVEKKFKPGQVLVKEGEDATSILIIKSGLVRISKGAEEIEIATIGAGESLGELSFLDGGARSATATAVEPTLVVRVPYVKLFALLERELTLAKEFYKSASFYIARRLRKTTGDLQFSKEFVAKYAKYF